MKYIHLLLLICFLLPVDAQAEKTILCGHFNIAHKASMSLQYTDNPVDDVEHVQQTLEVPVDDGGNFQFTFDINKPTVITLRNDDKLLFYGKFISPGDSVKLSFNSNSIDIDGRGENTMDFMFQFANKFLTGTPLFEKQNCFRVMEPMEFAKYRTGRMKAELAYLDSFCKQNPIPGVTKKAIENYFTYDAAVDLVQFAFRGRKGSRNVYSDSAYYKIVKSIPFSNPDAIGTGYYAHFLRELCYNFHQCKSDEKVFDSATVAYNKVNSLKLKDSIAKVYLKDEPYEIALYTILYEPIKHLPSLYGSEMMEKEYKHLDSNLTKLGKSFTHAAYRDRLRSLLDASIAEHKPAPDFTAYDFDGKQVKLSDYRGKVVYADIWATTCAPCKAEMPYAKKLQKQFEGKDVTFLFLSTDNNMNVAKGYLKSEDMAGVHLIDTKGFASDVCRKYHISGIPRYLLVSKSGILLSSDAPRPSMHPEKMIEKALEEK